MSTTSVAQRNIEMARTGYEAFNKADVEAVITLLAEDVVWHGGLRGPLAGDYKGKDAVIGFFMKFGQVTEGSYQADIHDILADDEHTIVMGTARATRKGMARQDRFVDVIHPDGEGKVKEFWRFFEDQVGQVEWLEA